MVWAQHRFLGWGLVTCISNRFLRPHVENHCPPLECSYWMLVFPFTMKQKDRPRGMWNPKLWPTLHMGTLLRKEGRAFTRIANVLRAQSTGMQACLPLLHLRKEAICNPSQVKGRLPFRTGVPHRAGVPVRPCYISKLRAGQGQRPGVWSPSPFICSLRSQCASVCGPVPLCRSREKVFCPIHFSPLLSPQLAGPLTPPVPVRLFGTLPPLLYVVVRWPWAPPPCS